MVESTMATLGLDYWPDLSLSFRSDPPPEAALRLARLPFRFVMKARKRRGNDDDEMSWLRSYLGLPSIVDKLYIQILYAVKMSMHCIHSTCTCLSTLSQRIFWP